MRKPSFYRAMRLIAAALIGPYFGLTVEGTEFIPGEQRFILMSNHISSWDPIMLAVAVRSRDVCFMAKEALFKFPPLGWLLRRVNVIRVSRSGTNLSAMRSALTRLAQGRCVGIFPEGHRYKSGGVHPFETGVAMLALNTNAPVLPAYVSGEYGFRKGVSVRFGPLIQLDDLRKLPKDSETIAWIQHRLRKRLVDLSKNGN
ncbi:MAG: 1-acyl-sn-glycerol-3-phosphate acyltransferase [Oscillospiraceae bacterium]|jgi:1-acyl-sn-glycerol-3-phosphate acyltransferase|nr:1-acyl-sn-glycerol-3-phosphate acyltransferase [Oscillospiraceae bacterium]